MKLRFSNQSRHAMTLVEVLVVIVVLGVLVAMLLPYLATARRKASRINCVNSLHQIGLSYYSWAGDHNSKLPFQVPVALGGSMELAANGNVVATFQIMSNELSTPKILHCPVDNVQIETYSFANLANSNISYFIGLDASKDFPQAMLSGDDNLQISGVPVKPALLQLATNMAAYWADVPIDWTDTRHKPSNGNIGLADGSARETYYYSLRGALHQTGLATNRLAIP